MILYSLIIRIVKQLKEIKSNKMDPEQPIMSNEQKLKKLYSIAEKLQEKPQPADALIRDFISTYVESHHLSQEYFISLCENRFLMLMFQNSQNIQQSTCILECLNLLLTNTKNAHELVYILSQNSIHEYLFGANILQRDSQFVQYYVQLVKTILLKISQSDQQQNKSLIRMFCNSKYPGFPMLTYVTILACDSNQLIRVTAQQCVLILVGLINQKKIYEIYLSQLPMIIFVTRLATQFLKSDTDHEGVCKYFADLMYQLRNNRTPLFLICNIICNIVIVSSLPKRIHVALSFIQLLTKSIQVRVIEHKNLNNFRYLSKEQKNDAYFQKKFGGTQKFMELSQQQACDTLILICASFYRILIKYMTNKYINSVYLSAYIHFYQSSAGLNGEQQNQISLPLRVSYPGTQAQFKLLQDYSIKEYIEQQHSSSEVEISVDILDYIYVKTSQYSTSKEFIKLKQNYLKKIPNSKKAQSSGGFFGRIFNRGTTQQLNTQYIKYVSDFASVNLQKGLPLGLYLARQINPSLCPFFSQFILLSTCLKKGLKFDNMKTGQQSDEVEPDQIHFNDIRSSWSFTLVGIDIMSLMAKRFNEFINSSQASSKSIVVPKMFIPPSYLFLGQLKDYIATSIHEHINRQPKNHEFVNSMQMLICLTKICSYLNVQLCETAYISLITELTAIHQQIQNCLFQNGFIEILQYIKFRNKLTVLQIENQNRSKLKNNKMEQEKMTPQKKLSGIKIKVKPSLTFIKMCCFQCIQKIMDPHIKPLVKHFQSKWKQTFSKNPIHFSEFYEEALSSYRVTFFGKNGCIMSFLKLMIPSTIIIRIELGNKKMLQVDLLQLQAIKQNTIDNRVLQFSGSNVENVKLETPQLAAQILQKFKQYRFILEECITNSALEYLSSSSDTLNIKGKKLMRSSHKRYSMEFETPGQ